MQCPLCRSRAFYLKDTQDEYEMYPFEIKDGRECFSPEVDADGCLPVTGGTEIWCDKCSWHGRRDQLT